MPQDQVFDTSATELANYRGQAENALGGDPGASNLIGQSNTDQISPALRILAAANMAKNKGIYDAQVKKQNDLFSQLSSDDVTLKVMLPQDRDYILKNFREPIRTLAMDPAVLTDFKKSGEFSQKMNDFKEAKAYAAVRIAAINDMDKAIAAEENPERRQRMTDHRNEMYNQDLYSQVKPFQELLNFAVEDIPTVDAVTTPVSSGVVGDQEVSVNHIWTPLRKFTETSMYNYLKNPDVKIRYKYDVLAQSLHEAPPDHQKFLVDSYNTAIRNADAKEKLSPTDKDYVPEIRYDPVDANGEPVTDGDQYKIKSYAIHATAPEIARAQGILDNYKNETVTTAKTTTIAAQIRHFNAETEKAKMDAWLAMQRGKVLIPAQAENFRAMALEHNAKASKVFNYMRQAKEDKGAGAEFYINQLKQTFDPAKYGSAPDVNSAPPGLVPPGIHGKVVVSPVTTAQLSPEEMVYMSEPFEIAGKKSLVAPETVIYNDTNTKDPYFLATYRIANYNKDTKQTTTTFKTRTIRPNNLLQNIVTGVFKGTKGSVGLELQATNTKWKELTGKDNINGSLFSEYDKPEWQGKNSKLDDFMNK